MRLRLSLLLKFATFRFVHCSCMLIEDRSVYILILQYLVRVNRFTFVTDDFPRREAHIYDGLDQLVFKWTIEAYTYQEF